MTQVQANNCPVCNSQLDGISGTRRPRPTDLCVCLYCYAVLQFKDDMTLEIMTEEPDSETQEILADLIRQLRHIKNSMNN
jgi:hypothetical protein